MNRIRLATLLFATAALAVTARAATPPPGWDPATDITPGPSTLQPFVPGDVFVAATVMNDPADDHAGIGRVIQYDAELRPKGQLWLKGSTHKVGGLTFGPDGTLWSMAQLTPVVMEIGPDGVQKPVRKFSDHKYSSVTFGRDGSLYFCDHMTGKQTGHPAVTTKFKLLPGQDVIGNGHIFRHAADGRLVREYSNEVHGGSFGFLACTSTVLTDGDRRMIYVSETGNRVMQYDLPNDRQLPDLRKFEGDPRVPMVLVMNANPTGPLFVSTANGFITLDRDSGEVLRHYPLPGMGWAAINPSPDGRFAFVGNFFTGEFFKVRLDDGAVVARNNIGQKESLSGVAQYAGRKR
jgi:outer membrane protein assembly factor BamB